MSVIIKSEPECDSEEPSSYHTADIASSFQTCRLCLSEESAESVHNEEGLQQWISDYLSIEISSEDHLSQAVCATCRIQLMEFHQFRERCHEVQSALKSKTRTGKELEDQLLLESIQNVVADELVDIEEMKIDANMELTALSDAKEHTNETQATEVQKEDGTENHQSHECEICYKIMHSRMRLNSHMKNVHGPKRFKCVTCEVTFPQPHHLKLHFQTKRHVRKMQDSEVQKESVSNSEFQCDKCQESFSKKVQLYNHCCTIDELIKHPCPKCQKLFASRYDMYKHIAADHMSGEDRPFKCDICPKTFKVKNHWAEHKRQVHGPKRYRCVICEFSSSKNYNVTRHMKNHDRIKRKKAVGTE
ncbi:zinc finger protein 624 [Aedes albopictus]|uniref:C2h2-type zn-finger protein n=1 Tax=Aedes albopictus TaxID=7160 RepID=A0ABM1XP09_AEDAL|nr:zinc finger protein 624-like [Aedes albopictus]